MTTMDHPDSLILEIEAYKTEDGKIFEELEAARVHARELCFETWYRDYPMSRYPFHNDVLGWLLEHKQVVLQLYGRC